MLSSITAAGIDYTKYDDGPIVFFGWKNSVYFAVAAGILFGISGAITTLAKDDQGRVEGGTLGCLLYIINLAMIICVVCSAYLLIPLGLIYLLLRGNKK